MNGETSNDDAQNYASGTPYDAEHIAPESASQSADQYSPVDARSEIEMLRAQLQEATTVKLRLMADYQNFQRRSMTNERLQFSEGVARAVSGVVSVIDHFDIALLQDPAKASAQQIMDGVRVVRDELLKSLAASGVVTIRPSHNEEFVPGRHEAVMQQPAEDVTPGHINTVFQPGYAIQTATGERVLRPAKVTVG